MPSNWFADVGRFLGGWPDDYTSIDFETNGGGALAETTLPVEAGWTIVEGREVTLTGSVLLDWTRPEYDINANWLAQTLDNTRYNMAKQGKSYGITIARMREEGVDPREALEAIHATVLQACCGGSRLVGHNALYFDLPLFGRTAGEFLGLHHPIDPALVVDTMLIEKCRGNKRTAPLPGDATIADWWASCRKGRQVKANLGEHCVSLYGLDVDASRAHTAQYDSYMVHLLLEAMRGLSERPVGV